MGSTKLIGQTVILKHDINVTQWWATFKRKEIAVITDTCASGYVIESVDKKRKSHGITIGLHVELVSGPARVLFGDK